MKTLIIASLAVVAFVCVHGHPTKENFAAKKAEMREKWAAMSEDERLEAIKKVHEKFENLHEKFESLSLDERKELFAHIQEKLPEPVREHLAKLSDEQKEKMRAAIDKYHKMSDEELLQKIEKYETMRKNKLAREHFKEMPENIRLEHREKFESLSPEEKQKLHDAVHRRRFPDGEGARAYADDDEEVKEEVKPVEVEEEKKDEVLVKPSRPNYHHKLSEEERKKIRESFEKLTPEQRDELRKHHGIHARFPSMSGPVPAAADDDEIVEIKIDGEVLVDKVAEGDLLEIQEQPEDLQQIRDRLDDILVDEEWIIVSA
jgi:hypothetical protein